MPVRPLSVFARRMFALSRRQLDAPKTFAFEPSLPRLPVPTLQHTLKAYLKSLEPLTRDDVVQKEQLRQREDWATDFENSELGRALQQRLLDIERAAPYNWLDDNFWVQYAYHSKRAPLPINSSWWCLGGTFGVPDQVLLNAPPNGQFSASQLKRAALILYRFLEFRQRLEREEIPPDSSRTSPFCMHQYRRIFGVTRLPGKPIDTFSDTPFPAAARHVVVIVREQLYSLDVIDQTGNIVSRSALETSLRSITQDVQSRSAEDLDASIATLTAGDRDSWAENRSILSQLSERNRSSLETMDSALLCLALDDWTRSHPQAGTPLASRLLDSSVPFREATLDELLDGHILNAQAGGPTPGRSRWFDKTINICVESNTRASVVGEHSPCEALLPALVFDYALAEKLEGLEWEQRETNGGGEWSRIRWDVNEKIQRGIMEAQAGAESLVADSDARVLYADEYGTDFIRQIAKMPSDAYIQMALQLAYRRLHGRFTAVYETASTRMFLHGRTEVIRSFTSESRAFCETMVTGANNTFELLQRACAAHQSLTKQASRGQGCDRHLLALRLLMREGEDLPALFSDDLFSASQDWRLSTSGLTAGDRFVGTGFGAPVKDGYGINYLAGKNLIKFGIESKRSSPDTDTHQFRLAVARALRDMRQLCESAKP